MESHQPHRDRAARRLRSRKITGVVDVLHEEPTAGDLRLVELLPRSLQFDGPLLRPLRKIDRRIEVRRLTGRRESDEFAARLERGILIRRVVVTVLRDVFEF